MIIFNNVSALTAPTLNGIGTINCLDNYYMGGAAFGWYFNHNASTQYVNIRNSNVVNIESTDSSIFLTGNENLNLTSENNDINISANNSCLVYVNDKFQVNSVGLMSFNTTDSYIEFISGNQFIVSSLTDINLTSIEQRITLNAQNEGISISANNDVTINSDSNTINLLGEYGVRLTGRTRAQILAFPSPIEGTMLYCNDINVLVFYDGTGWKKVVHLAL